MKLFKKIKKGFTLIELVVVIAVIAILSAVSLISYSSITNKAHQSNDKQLIDQVNLALAGEEISDGKQPTMHQMLQSVVEDGFVVENLKAESKNYEFAYSMKDNRFVILEKAEKVIYPEEYKNLPADSNIWRFYKKDADLKKGFSYYLTKEYTSETVEVNGGLDVGELNTIKTVSYENKGSSKDIVVRTNSEATTLNIDAPADTIKHYDEVGIVNIIRTANASYHEYGTANFVQNASGRVVAEDGGLIKTCVLTAKGTDATLAAVAQEDGGTIENCFATTNEVATANNGENAKNVQLVVESVANNGNVLAEGKTTEQIDAEIVSKKDEVAAEANNQNYTALTGVARIGGVAYQTLQGALDNVAENQVIVVLKDISQDTIVTYAKDFKALLDLAGNTLQVTGGNGGGRAIKIDSKNANLMVKNGTIDGRSYNNGELAPNPSSKGPWSATRVGGCIRVSNGDCTLENLNMYNNDGWGNAVKLECSGTLTMRNCKIESVYGACVEVGVGTANIYDCTFSQAHTANSSYISNCIAVCYLGVANIYDTTMVETEKGDLVDESTAGSGVTPLFVYDSGGAVNVYGGIFKTSSSNVIEIDAVNANKYINVEKDYTQEEYDAFVAANGAGSIVNIYNGSFTGNLKISATGTGFNVYGGTFSVDVSSYRK